MSGVMRSNHLAWISKMNVTISAGFASGSAMRRNIEKYESPSIRAAANRSPNRKLRSGKRKYAKAKATSALENVVSAAPSALIQTLFQSQRATGAMLNKYCLAGIWCFGPVKFQDQWCGISALSKTSDLILNDALISQRNG